MSRWVNDIPGFDWSDREAFTERVLDDVPENTADGSTTGSADDTDDTVGSDGDSTDTAETATGDTVEGTEDDTESSRGGVETEDDVDGATEVADLRRRVGVLEDRLERQSGNEGPGETDRERDETSSDQIDTELLHKVVHACMDSERITDEEEIRLLDHLLG